MHAPNEGAGWERLFRLVFERSSNPIILLDDERRIVEVNDAALQLFGGARDQLIGMSIVESIRPAERELAAREWEQFLKTGEYAGTRALVRAGDPPDQIAALRPRMPSGIPLVREDLPFVRALQGEAVCAASTCSSASADAICCSARSPTRCMTSAVAAAARLRCWRMSPSAGATKLSCAAMRATGIRPRRCHYEAWMSISSSARVSPAMTSMYPRS